MNRQLAYQRGRNDCRMGLKRNPFVDTPFFSAWENGWAHQAGLKNKRA